MTDKKLNDCLPVSGYRPQGDLAVGRVNHNKQIEERILRVIDELGVDENVDKRWLAIAKTDIERGFMALNRSIFKPERIKLYGED